MELLFQSATRRLRLNLNGKFNIILGKSGTGKSLLAQEATDISRDKDLSRRQPTLISGDHYDVERWARMYQGAILILDEARPSYEWDRLIEVAKRSKNYYIICSREGPANVPYGVDTTFKLDYRQDELRMVPAYPKAPLQRNPSGYAFVITEYQGTGYLVARYKTSLSVIPAEGKDKLGAVVTVNAAPGRRALVLFDACGIGRAFPQLLDKAMKGSAILYDSKSFEHEVLTTVLARESFEPYLAQCLYFASEEEYYTKVLTELFQRSFGSGYSKSGDSECAALLATGKGRLHSRFVNLSDLGYDHTKFYPFLTKKAQSTPAFSSSRKLNF